MIITLADVIGYAATIVGTDVMLPQIVKSLRTKRVEGLSLGLVWLYFFNCLLWLAYGILIRAFPVVIANGIGLVVGVTQVSLKWKYRQPNKHRPPTSAAPLCAAFFSAIIKFHII